VEKREKKEKKIRKKKKGKRPLPLIFRNVNPGGGKKTRGKGKKEKAAETMTRDIEVPIGHPEGGEESTKMENLLYCDHVNWGGELKKRRLPFHHPRRTF